MSSCSGRTAARPE